MIIHDLNNYFMAISGNLQLMGFDIEPHQIKMNRYMSNCLDSITEVTDMVRGLLDIHKMEEGKLVLKKTEIKLEAIVRTTVKSFEQIANKNNIAVSFLNPIKETCIHGDPGLLKRVIANLVSNALRHTPDSGEIEIKISPNQEGRRICLSVRDSGDGLASEYHEKIFEKFEQVDLKEKGVRQGAAGLGLSFCKMAVEAHHGRIWVESRGENHGCTFKIELPT